MASSWACLAAYRATRKTISRGERLGRASALMIYSCRRVADARRMCFTSRVRSSASHILEKDGRFFQLKLDVPRAARGGASILRRSVASLTPRRFTQGAPMADFIHGAISSPAADGNAVITSPAGRRRAEICTRFRRCTHHDCWLAGA